MTFDLKHRRTVAANYSRASQHGHRFGPLWTEQDQLDFEQEVAAVSWALDNNLLGDGNEAQWCRRWLDSLTDPDA